VQQVVEPRRSAAVSRRTFTSASLAKIAERAGSQTPAESSQVAATEPVRPAPTSPVISAVLEMAQSSPEPTADYLEAEYVEPDVFLDDDGFDEEPTQVFAGVAPRNQPEANGPLARPPPPLPSRRRAPLVIRRRALDPSASLIRASKSAPVRRPSDISELLDKMSVEPQPADEVYIGLKSLSRVEISPPAPPVNAAWIEDGGQ
jgi:hypothetical protein